MIKINSLVWPNQNICYIQDFNPKNHMSSASLPVQLHSHFQPPYSFCAFLTNHPPSYKASH